MPEVDTEALQAQATEAIGKATEFIAVSSAHLPAPSLPACTPWALAHMPLVGAWRPRGLAS